MHAQPRLPLHRAVRVAARRGRHRWPGQGGHRPGHALPRPRHRAHDGRLVPGRRLQDPLPGQVAHLPSRPHHSRDTREPEGQRRRGRARPRRGRRVPPGRSPRPLRLLRLDRARAARRRQGRHRHHPRRCVRAGDLRPLRADRDGGRRRAVVGGGVVREPARHRVHRRRLEPPRLPADRRLDPRDPRGAVTVRLVRRPSRLPVAVQGGVAEGPLSAGPGRRVPPALPLPPGPGRRRDHAHPRRARGARAGRQHRHRLHVRPRRHAGRARGAPPEVAQRVRRVDPRPTARVGPGHRHQGGGCGDRHQPPRPRAHAARARRRRRRSRRRPRWRVTTSRRNRWWDATCRRC